MTELVIICNRCGMRSEAHRNAGMKIGIIRGGLRMKGWYTIDRGGVDYCPGCWKALGEAAKKLPPSGE